MSGAKNAENILKALHRYVNEKQAANSKTKTTKENNVQDLTFVSQFQFENYRIQMEKKCMKF